MVVADQKALVRRLAALADERDRTARQRRRAFLRWKQETFANLDTLAWIFASGALWAASRGGRKGKSQFKRIALNAANASVLAWRIVERTAVAGAGQDAGAGAPRPGARHSDMPRDGNAGSWNTNED